MRKKTIPFLQPEWAYLRGMLGLLQWHEGDQVRMVHDRCGHTIPWWGSVRLAYSRQVWQYRSGYMQNPNTGYGKEIPTPSGDHQ